jgi:hypothetical protein
MAINHYNRHMPKNKFEDALYDAELDLKNYSRQEINKLMLEIDEDVGYLMKCYAPPSLIRHHHELLSKLIKRYGH